VAVYSDWGSATATRSTSRRRIPTSLTSEEAGLGAGLALLLIYALLVTRGLQVALIARLPFNRLLALGLTSVLALQTMVIIGGNLKLIPLTGVTLPFVSYGGSSLLANFLILGVLLRMSHEERLIAWTGRSRP
jgi:cell division protein FtsW (lipid II flippase)